MMSLLRLGSRRWLLTLSALVLVATRFAYLFLRNTRGCNALSLGRRIDRYFAFWKNRSISRDRSGQNYWQDNHNYLGFEWRLIVETGRWLSGSSYWSLDFWLFAQPEICTLGKDVFTPFTVDMKRQSFGIGFVTRSAWPDLAASFLVMIQLPWESVLFTANRTFKLFVPMFIGHVLQSTIRAFINNLNRHEPSSGSIGWLMELIVYLIQQKFPLEEFPRRLILIVVWINTARFWTIILEDRFSIRHSIMTRVYRSPSSDKELIIELMPTISKSREQKEKRNKQRLPLDWGDASSSCCQLILSSATDTHSLLILLNCCQPTLNSSWFRL